MTRTSAKRRAPTHRQNRDLIVARLRMGMTPNALGKRAGVSGNTVLAAERGDYVTPHSQIAIANALEVPDVFLLFPFERQREAA
ncbi:helix-turn-helix transcriptional regulator [Patulibacter minatonensis]|uniref:helix-turn-helix transcriptional regulator n=1 Tax=Patulibacter minatonensis TaxID=298163 RepID=UPI0012FC41DA|nr:helix-turn-helix transcriptional regulator [Patulibacter minatonensis]